VSKKDEAEANCNAIVSVVKDSCWNLKRHWNHPEVMKKIEAAQQGKVVINKRYHEILLYRVRKNESTVF